MDIPEDLREIVDRLGQALVQALVTDEACRSLARQIQDSGYEIGLMIEATLALRRREEGEETEEQPGENPSAEPPLVPEAPQERDSVQWSEEDRAFLRKFKISID